MYIMSSINIVDSLSIAASEEVSTFEAANIQDPIGWWRSTGLTPYIYGQFASSVTTDSFGVYFSNAVAGDQHRLRLATSEANLTASPVRDVSLADVWPGSPTAGYIASWPFVHSRTTYASVSASWWRLDCNYTGNSDGYVQFRGLFIAQRFTPTSAPPPSIIASPEYRGVYEVQFADGGIARGGGVRKLPVSFMLYLTKAEYYGTLKPMLRELRSVLPVSVVMNENEDDYPMDEIYYGYLHEESVTITQQNYEVRLSLREY